MFSQVFRAYAFVRHKARWLMIAHSDLTRTFAHDDEMWSWSQVIIQALNKGPGRSKWFHDGTTQNHRTCTTSVYGKLEVILQQGCTVPTELNTFLFFRCLNAQSGDRFQVLANAGTYWRIGQNRRHISRQNYSRGRGRFPNQTIRHRQRGQGPPKHLYMGGGDGRANKLRLGKTTQFFDMSDELRPVTMWCYSRQHTKEGYGIEERKKGKEQWKEKTNNET